MYRRFCQLSLKTQMALFIGIIIICTTALQLTLIASILHTTDGPKISLQHVALSAAIAMFLSAGSILVLHLWMKPIATLTNALQECAVRWTSPPINLPKTNANFSIMNQAFNHIATTQQRSLNDLARSEQVFRLASASLPSGILLLDIGLGAIYANRAWQDLTGQKASEAIGLNWLEVFSTNDRSLVAEHLYGDDALGSLDVRVTPLLGGSKGVWLHLVIKRIEPTSTATDIPAKARFIISAFDITDRKQYEVNLESQALAAQRSSQNKAQFFANLSHEIRTPLTSLVGYSDLLAAGRSPTLEDGRRWADIVRQNSEILLNIVDDALYRSRIEPHCNEVPHDPSIPTKERSA